MEVTAEAEQRWIAEMENRAVDNSTFEMECTPGYYNNEGNAKGRKSLFGGMYGGGPVAYMSHLDNWFSDEYLQDVTISYQ